MERSHFSSDGKYFGIYAHVHLTSQLHAHSFLQLLIPVTAYKCVISSITIICICLFAVAIIFLLGNRLSCLPFCGWFFYSLILLNEHKWRHAFLASVIAVVIKPFNYNAGHTASTIVIELIFTLVSIVFEQVTFLILTPIMVINIRIIKHLAWVSTLQELIAIVVYITKLETFFCVICLLPCPKVFACIFKPSPLVFFYFIR